MYYFPVGKEVVSVSAEGYVEGSKVRRVLVWAGEKAAEGLIVAIALAVLGGLVGLGAITLPAVAEWLDHTDEIDRWLLALLLIAAGLATPTALVSIAAFRRWRDVPIEDVDLAAAPVRVDLSGVGPNSALIRLRVRDFIGRPVNKAKVDLYTPKGVFENNSTAISIWTGKNGIAEVEWFVTSMTTPGDVVISIDAHRRDRPAIIKTVTVSVVGAPAFLTLIAAPDRVLVGESVTVTAKIVDAIGQNVWDGTKLRLVTNAGSLTDETVTTTSSVGITFLLTTKTGRGVVVGTTETGITTQVSIHALPTESASGPGPSED